MIDLRDVKVRCCAVEQEYFAARGVLIGAVPYFVHVQEELPYTTHRTSRGSYGYNSQHLRTVIRIILIRFVVGHVTEGYVGGTDEKLDDYVEMMMKAFESHQGRHLISTAYPEGPVYLTPLGVDLKEDTGIRFFPNTGLGVTQVGVDFTLEVPLIDEVCRS